MTGKKPKIAIIFPKDSIGFFLTKSSDSFGGATVQLHQIASEMHSLKCDLLCLIPNSSELSERLHVSYPFIEPYKKQSFFIVKIFGVLRVIKQNSPDFVLQRGLTFSSILFSLFSKMFGIKFVFMFAHDIETKGYYQNSRRKAWFFRLMLESSYRLICQSDVQRMNIPPKYLEKVFIVKKGIKVDKTDYSRKNKVYDASWIGRCEKWKNPNNFISIAKSNPNMKFLMVCSKIGSELKFFESIKEQSLKVSNLDFFETAPNSQIKKFLSMSKTLCITSDMEGDWPMTVLEASSLGLPIISLYFDNDDFLEKHNGGYFCKGSLEILNEKLKKLIKSQKDYDNKSKASRHYALQNYDLRKNVTLLLDAL